MTDKSPQALDTYRENLRKLVRKTRSLRAQPVLVTSMERKDTSRQESLRQYPRTVCEVAAELNLPLNALSRGL